METPKKSIIKSKVFWFNLLTIIVTAATFFGYAPDPEVAQNVTGNLLVASPIVNLILRFFTNKSVTI